MDRLVKEFGSQFELLDSLKDEVCNLEHNDNIKYLSSGRECLYVVGEKCLSNGIKKIYMPALCCPAMVQPFKQLNFDVVYYNIREDLSIDIDDLHNRLCNDSLVLVMHYYGFRGFEDQDIIALKERYSNLCIVQDCTQHYFSKDLYSPNADYIISSIRKWISVPDGALLYSEKEDIDVNLSKSTFSNIWYKAMCMKKDYLHTGDTETKDEYRKLFGQCTTLLKGDVTPSDMSVQAIKLYQQHNIGNVIESRTKNHQRLIERTRGKYGKFVRYNKAQTCPLCFVITVNNRDAVQSTLASRNIYSQVLWPIPDEAKNFEFSNWFSTHMLAVPCDHRYSVEDMDYIANNLINILDEYEVF